MSKENKEAIQELRRLDDYDYCFACGVNNPIGLRMEVQYAPETARSRITLPRQFEGWKDIIHGGIVATLLDEIMAHAVLQHVGDAVTTALTVSYRAALRVDQQVEVIGRIKERNRRGVVAEAEMRTVDGAKLLAKAESRFILLSGLLSRSSP
jgi:acyl-coenzyme A thioesterase PaaI-like protein